MTILVSIPIFQNNIETIQIIRIFILLTSD